MRVLVTGANGQLGHDTGNLDCLGAKADKARPQILHHQRIDCF